MHKTTNSCIPVIHEEVVLLQYMMPHRVPALIVPADLVLNFFATSPRKQMIHVLINSKIRLNEQYVKRPKLNLNGKLKIDLH